MHKNAILCVTQQVLRYASHNPATNLPWPIAAFMFPKKHHSMLSYSWPEDATDPGKPLPS